MIISLNRAKPSNKRLTPILVINIQKDVFTQNLIWSVFFASKNHKFIGRNHIAWKKWSWRDFKPNWINLGPFFRTIINKILQIELVNLKIIIYSLHYTSKYIKIITLIERAITFSGTWRHSVSYYRFCDYSLCLCNVNFRNFKIKLKLWLHLYIKDQKKSSPG